MNLRTVTHDDLKERDEVLDKIGAALEAVQDLRDRCKVKGDWHRCDRLYGGKSALERAARIVAEAWK